MAYIRQYKRVRGIRRHEWNPIPVKIIETIPNGHQTIGGSHPNYTYQYQPLYKVQKLSPKTGKPVGKIIETPYVYFNEKD